VPGASDTAAVLRLTPWLTQPPPFGLFTVIDVDVLPTNTSPLVNLPEILVDVTDAYVSANCAPVDVFPLFHLTDTLAVPGFVYAMTCAQFSFSDSSARKVKSPPVIPGVPVQPERVPSAASVWATLTVGDTGGVSVSVPAKVVHVNTVAAVVDEVDVADGADVVDAAGAELLDEALLEHAGRNAEIAINVAVVKTRRLRTRVTSVPAKLVAHPTSSARRDNMVS
jgi:hypothetical protein